MANILENQLVQVLEKQLDEQLDRLDNLDTDDLKAIREQRIKEMKEINQKKQEWLKNVSNIPNSILATCLIKLRRRSKNCILFLSMFCFIANQ